MSAIEPGATAVVTGASSGIGRAVAVDLAVRGVNLVLVARNAEKLEETAQKCRAAYQSHAGGYRSAPGGTRTAGAADRPPAVSPPQIHPGSTAASRSQPQVTVHRTDLADAAARAALIRELQRRTAPIDYVFANAGVSQRSRALETSETVEEQLWQVNYRTVVDLARSLLPPIVERGRGWFAAVSSMSAYVGAPWRSTYGATKAAVNAYISTLANELHDSPVGIHLVIPGFVRTGVSMAALHADGTRHGRMDPRQDRSISPETASVRIIRGIFRGKRRIFVGMTPVTRLMVWLSAAAPGIVDPLLRRADLGQP